MFNHTLINRSLAAGLLIAAAAFPVAAQARYATDSGGVPSASPVLTAGPPATASVSPVGPTDASSGGYTFPASAVSATAQTGSSFHWGDAGIGAGSIVVLLGASGLGAVAMRRRRPQRTLVS